MNIDYYAPSTSTEYRMWAVDQITDRFKNAVLVAVHDKYNFAHVSVDVHGDHTTLSNHMMAEIISYTCDLPKRYALHRGTL